MGSVEEDNSGNKSCGWILYISASKKANVEGKVEDIGLIVDALVADSVPFGHEGRLSGRDWSRSLTQVRINGRMKKDTGRMLV